MKIVLLDTGRGVNPDTIRMWRENLELQETDEVALMAWQPPREPLPVVEHLVFGPRLDLKNTTPREVETLGDLFGGHDLDAATLAEGAAQADDLDALAAEDDDPDSNEIGSDDSPVSESDLAGQMAESVAESVTDHGERQWDATEFASPEGDHLDSAHAEQLAEEAADAAADTAGAVPDATTETTAESATSDVAAQPASAPAPSPSGPSNAAHSKVAGLPVYHPDRLRHAVTWRGRKALTHGRRAVGKAKRAAKKDLKVSDTPLAKAAQRAIATRNGSIATQFAIALARSPEAAELFRSADLVFPVDARSQRGAWMLARANAGPDVMVGYPAAIRALSARREA